MGKTLTAESVAEKIKAPLFKMELMEDYTDLSEIDSSFEVPLRPNHRKKQSVLSSLTIEDQFEHAINWKAVLLFDECDAYLGKRCNVDAQSKLILNRKLPKILDSVFLEDG